ncbi:MAG: hypothetical protein KZQ76_07270 [Candidatus Thiodiazotropha sp. (ex Epidulcina cf. delphinae)]|nr:hypothetical protein [Candidatus Thiodiazotropha sp. (ex Epidulcina cf. delphinae)]
MKRYFTPIIAVTVGIARFTQGRTQVVATIDNNGYWLEDVDAYGSTVAWNYWNSSE